MRNLFGPSLATSLLAGGSRGPVGFGGRLDFGLGALWPDTREQPRGLGYLLNFGPVARAHLLEGPAQLSATAEASWMRVATFGGDKTCDPCVTGNHPRIALQGLALGMGLQIVLHRFLFELRYLRPFWYRFQDEARGVDRREWNFLRLDQWFVSFGFWDDHR